MDVTHNPADIPAPGSYHWTPRLQRAFLENLCHTGSVKMAAASVSMSSRAAYDLKQRPQGAAFRLGWAAAVLIARGRLADELLDRAIWGYEETSTITREDGRSFVRRQRSDPRLGLAMLARLDRMVETRAQAGEAMLAQIIAGDWAGFLSLFDAADVLAPDGAGADNKDAEGRAGGLGAALALWLAGRDNRANPLAALWQDSAIASEVAQFSVDSEPEEQAGPTPEADAAAMTVWRTYVSGELRTNFPPPADYAGFEDGEFGDRYYQRTLDHDEEEAWEAARAEACAPLRAAGEAARRAFFALPDPANDPAPEGGAARTANG